MPTTPYLGCSGSHSSLSCRSSRRGPADRSSAPCSPGLSGTSPGSCGQTALPGRLEKTIVVSPRSPFTHALTAQRQLGCHKPRIATLRRHGSWVLLRRWVVQPCSPNWSCGLRLWETELCCGQRYWGCAWSFWPWCPGPEVQRGPHTCPGHSSYCWAPTSLAAGAHEPRRADAFTNVVVADAAVQTVGTVLLTRGSPFLRGAGCEDSGGSPGWHQAGGRGMATCPCPKDPGPHSPLTIRR